MTCPDCSASLAAVWEGFTAGCPNCCARALARIFLAKEERGQRFRRACAQLGVTVEQVQDAWASDATNPEAKP